MHDIRAIREAPDRYVDGWSRRGVADARALVDEILALDTADRAAKTRFEGAQAERNAKSKLIGAAKAAKDEARAAGLMAEVEALKATLAEAEAAQKAADAGLNGRDGVLARLPNLAAEGVPPGEDEAGNVEQKRWRDPAATPAGERGLRVDHATLGEALGLMDFERAARMSGSRFVALKGGLARLERALGQFMLDVQTREHGYTEVSPPLLVRSDAMFGTGQLPKFADDLFAASQHSDIDEAMHKNSVSSWCGAMWYAVGLTAEELQAKAKELPNIELEGAALDHHWLIPTAEVSLTNLVREEITPEEQLPLRLTALTPCFRSEAGASGRDTRGLIRQHQFHKVEMVSITAPEQSDEEHERMTACAEAVLEKLELPYRRMLLCDGDMGFSARRTYDLEVWLPSEGRYREISSCSTCGDFQARRMEARFKRAGEKGAPYVHTLNGSGLAVGRALVAVMESYQDEGGRIAVPDALLGYTGGMTHVERG